MAIEEYKEILGNMVTTDFKLYTDPSLPFNISYYPYHPPSSLPEGKLEIEVDEGFLKNQNDRIVRELDLNSKDAEIISQAVGDMVGEKIKERKKQWSDPVIKAFTNLIIGVLIEETKALTQPTITSQEDSYAINEVMIA